MCVMRQKERLHSTFVLCPPSIVHSVLRLFDELVKCDEEGVLKDVRKAVEGVG